MTAALFRAGEFRLHSGAVSRWKIDCDSLTDEDWEALALMLAERLPPFGDVVGVPQGGLALASALWPYAVKADDTLPDLVVDDVLTTGRSMEGLAAEVRAENRGVPVIGAVVFARGPCPEWVYPLFQMR